MARFKEQRIKGRLRDFMKNEFVNQLSKPWNDNILSSIVKQLLSELKKNIESKTKEFYSSVKNLEYFTEEAEEKEKKIKELLERFCMNNN